MWCCGGPETPSSGMSVEASPLPLLCCVYWVVLTGLVLLLLLSLAVLFVRGAATQGKPSISKPSRQGDPEEALVDALHVVDAIMEKIWHRLERLERKQRDSQEPATA